MLTIQGTLPLQLQQVNYTQMPERDKLIKISRLYANAFADWPWNEYKVCPEGTYFGRQQAELTSCTNCSQPLKLAYPEEDTADYITKELSKAEGTLITFEEENGGVLAAGWGYACSAEDLQAKYNSSEMKEKVVDKIWRTAEKVERVFYLSEIMVDASVRKQGIATKIAKDLVVKAQFLRLNSVMRTRFDSPMVYIANNMQMAQVLSLGEDKDNDNRVLFLKYRQDNG